MEGGDSEDTFRARDNLSMLRVFLKRVLGSREPDQSFGETLQDSGIYALKLDEPREWVGRYPDIPPPDRTLTLQMFAARFACGVIYGEDTPALAADLLEAGFDSPSLRRLAGETQVRCNADAAELVDRITREAGLPVPFPVEKARLLVSRQIARQVIAGERDPWRGAADLQGIWGWRSYPSDEQIRGILTAADEDAWDPKAQRFRPAVDSDLLDSFARLAMLRDDQLFSAK